MKRLASAAISVAIMSAIVMAGTSCELPDASNGSPGAADTTDSPGSPTTNLRITEQNLAILNGFGETAYDVVSGPPESFKRLRWKGYGEFLKVEGTSYLNVSPVDGNNTRIGHPNSSPGECVSAVLALSWTKVDAKSAVVSNWVKGSNVMTGQAKPGDVVATFFADAKTKYPYANDGSPRHVVIFLAYSEDGKGFWAWDQNWYSQRLLGKHFIGSSGSDVVNASNYSMVQVNNPAYVPSSSTPTPHPVPTPTTPSYGGSSIKYGQSVVGVIAKAGDCQDWRFSGVKGEVVTIRMLRDNNVTLSCYLGLLDGASGQELRNSYYGSGQAEARVQNYVLPVTGAYVIRATGGSSTVGAYTLSLSVNAAPRKLGYGQQGNGMIPVSKSYEDWTFNGAKGEVVTIRMLRDNNVTLSCYLGLLDGASGQELSNSYYGSGQAEARVQNYVLPVTGAYVIRSTGGSDTTGAYTLSLSVNAAPRKLSYGQQGSGTIPVSKSYEDWTFNGVKGEVVTVRMLRDNNVTLSCYLQLLDGASGQELKNSYYGSGQAEARVENYALPVTGPYVIRSIGGSDTTGAYTLRLTKQ